MSSVGALSSSSLSTAVALLAVVILPVVMLLQAIGCAKKKVVSEAHTCMHNEVLCFSLGKPLLLLLPSVGQLKDPRKQSRKRPQSRTRGQRSRACKRLLAVRFRPASKSARSQKSQKSQKDQKCLKEQKKPAVHDASLIKQH